MGSNTINSNTAVSMLNHISQNNISAETMMLQVQMMVTKDFDEQIRTIGRQIKFLGDIKKAYSERIQNIQNFLIQNPNTSREDGERYVEASSQQGEYLFGSMIEVEYDLSTLTANELPLQISDSGANHKLDDEGYVAQGAGDISASGVANFFSECSKISDPATACEFAKKAGDDNTSLPFYFGHTNNTFEDGSPKFAVLVESIEMIVEQMKGKLSDVEQESEELSTNLSQLSAQRKAGLDGAYQLIRKTEEMKSGIINKIQ